MAQELAHTMTMELPNHLQIGSVVVDPPILLAPMAGYTDAPFRSMCAHYGCQLAYTEMINTDALVRNSKRTLQMLAVHPEERFVAAHLYGTDPAVFAAAAHIVEGMGRFAIIDINAGCPVRKVMRRGAGAGLIANPDRLASIVTSVRSAVSLPVTVKTRIGLSTHKIVAEDLARAAEESGAAAITFHARFAAVQHDGAADWATIREVRSRVSIPVIGNGGVERPEDAARMFTETGVAGVMVGRATIGNPWFFAEVLKSMGCKMAINAGNINRRLDIMEHLDRLVRLRETDLWVGRRVHRTPEETAVLQFRPHLLGYLRKRPGWSAVRRTLNAMRSIDDVCKALDAVDMT